PVKIDFCEADVLDVFDEWRRAVGIAGTGQLAVASSNGDAEQAPARTAASRSSLPSHLERVVARLTNARALGTIGPEFDTILDRASAALDAARAKSAGLRGGERAALVEEIAALDRAMLATARQALGEQVVGELQRDADTEIAPFRAAMAPDAYARAREG